MSDHGFKTYVADRERWDRKIKVVSGTNEYWLNPTASQKFRNHSPDGFEWGYAGSGPAQAALAILLDLLGSDARDLVQRHYQEFKFAFIAPAGNSGFVITEEQIKTWLAERIKMAS